MGIDSSSRLIRVANIVEEGKLGGPQIRIVVAAAAMMRNVETTVIMPNENSEAFRKRCDDEGIRYKAMPISRITTEWRVALRYVFFFIIEIARIVRFLKKEKFDLIHVSGGSWQYKGVIAGKIAGIKVLWHLNDTSMPKLFRYLFSVISRLADGFIFASERSKHYYGSLITSEKPTYVIPAPVDTSVFSPAATSYQGKLVEQLSGKVVIGTVANVNPVKGLETLIQAASLVNETSRDVCFIVIGAVYKNQQRYYNKLQEMCTELSVDNVKFLGAQSNVKEFLKLIDIYLCSSVAESSPIAVWEAMAMGKPIVSTDVGDVPRYINNNMNGFVVDVGDSKSMADHLSKYVSNKKLRKMHGDKSRDIAVKKLDVKLCAARHVDAYSDINLSTG